jgi:hypothetical protein
MSRALHALVTRWKTKAAQVQDPRRYGEDPQDGLPESHRRVAETYTACARALEAELRKRKERR